MDLSGWDALPARRDDYYRRHVRHRSFLHRRLRRRMIYRPCRFRRNLSKNLDLVTMLDIVLTFRRGADVAAA